MPPALLETAHATVAIGDCRKILVLLPENSVDAIVTDPPYGLEFMGKEWDHGTPGVPFWLAALRVLKPGGHLLAFGGTRTFHRLTCALEDAGFEIRDTLSWLYGQGFPKSYNVAQSIEKVLTTGKARRPDVDLGARTRNRWSGDAGGTLIRDTGGQIALTTDAARQWEGWGTALKPAWEPIVLARKPLSEPTVAANVLRWGTGGLNIDATRITVDPVTDAPQLRTMKRSQRTTDMSGQTWGLSKKDGDEPQVIRPEGRWPANVVLDEEAAAMLDAQSGERTSGYMKPGQQRRTTLGAGGYHGNMPDEATAAGTYGDSGGASRFFYCSKASRTERDAGLEDHNSHPTVKPVTLMRWLVRLVTPPGGTVLDPFCGSGTTLIAAVLEGMETIGIELVEEYCQTAMDRLRYWETQL